MKYPTSIVSALLESDYVDYDSSLDPFSDPKNVTHNDLGTAYISRDDMTTQWPWLSCLVRFGLITDMQAWSKERSLRSTRQLIDSIDRIYIELVPALDSEARIMVHDLTKLALRRIENVFGTAVDAGGWPVRVVHVAYK